jgi:phospholipase C
VLQLAAGVSAAAAVAPDLVSRAAATAPASRDLEAIEHVVFFMQENRSFDHYFGTMRGVRGFDDRSEGALVFRQSWPKGESAHLLPFHLDTSKVGGAWVNDIDHSWPGQHTFWNAGKMNQWVSGHIESDGPSVGTACMGYYTRRDLPYYYALADAFTICDNYHCSVLASTYANRLYWMTGMIDPTGTAGGPVTSNPTIPLVGTGGILNWETMPERLQDAGITWKVYQPAGTAEYMSFGNNVLQLFDNYQDPKSPLFRNAFLPTFPGEFEADVAAGTLPSVSWVITGIGLDEHPPSPSSFGAFMASEMLRALIANPDVWSKTAVFMTYDEQGGFFDHVTPPTPPPGTKGEFLTSSPEVEEANKGNPIGLGFRVPSLVLSPFSRGGWVCSEVFDHTSTLRFLEARFGVKAPNLTAWRRKVVGDLTATLGPTADMSKPDLPAVSPPSARDLAYAATIAPGELGVTPSTPTYPPPSRQQMPRQEPGRRRRRGR